MSEPKPPLFVFHGGGGSDNMFFESFGAGYCVDLAEQPELMVVSPIQGLLSRLSLDYKQMVDLLIDYQTILPLGDSMGAVRGITQVNSHPELAAATVALGGVRGQRNASRLTQAPWFFASGEMNFGRTGARVLQRSLPSNNADSTYADSTYADSTYADSTYADSTYADSTYKEYPNIEHLVIVRAALYDVFQFLDCLVVVSSG